MPVQRCEEDGKPGFKWGRGGKCYTYSRGNLRAKARARLKAEWQGRAAYAAGYKGT